MRRFAEVLFFLPGSGYRAPFFLRKLQVTAIVLLLRRCDAFFSSIRGQSPFSSRPSTRELFFCFLHRAASPSWILLSQKGRGPFFPSSVLDGPFPNALPNFAPDTRRVGRLLAAGFLPSGTLRILTGLLFFFPVARNHTPEEKSFREAPFFFFCAIKDFFHGDPVGFCDVTFAAVRLFPPASKGPPSTRGSTSQVKLR